MKATELRIGNLYDHNGEYKTVTADVILEVWVAERNWVKPISLTEEWLLKFGSTGTYGNWQYTLPVGAITFHFRRNIEWYSELGGIYLGSKIKYVHQLQNLYFALTGEELKTKE